MTEKITVLLVDDHALVRRGFRRLLDDDPAIAVVGEASSGEEAIRLVASLEPAVVVMDCAMPGMSGLVATRAILAAAPQVKILMLTMHDGALGRTFNIGNGIQVSVRDLAERVIARTESESQI